MSRLIRHDGTLATLWWIIAGAEFVVGVLMLTLTTSRWPAALATTVLAGAAVFAVWGFRRAPDSPCGCFGAASKEPVSERTVMRAIVLTVAASTLVIWPGSWRDALTNPLVWGWGAAEVALLAILSPELGSLRQQLFLALRPGACVPSTLPTQLILNDLKCTTQWTDIASNITTEDPVEVWQDGCWQVFSFEAEYRGRPATAVFAIRLSPASLRVGGALVDEERREILVDTRRRRWPRWSEPPRQFESQGGWP